MKEAPNPVPPFVRRTGSLSLIVPIPHQSRQNEAGSSLLQKKESRQEEDKEDNYEDKEDNKED